MRHFYKSHGKHCYRRSFQSKCPICNTDVLYWECNHGCKVFFEYPPYGKLIKHYCRHHLRVPYQKDRFRIIVKKPKGLLDIITISCPVCGKLFKNEIILKDHLTQMKKNDLDHKAFAENQFLFEKERKKNLYSGLRKDETQYKPKFGKINIKKETKD
ncbi:MAG: hypothetical protein ACFE85_05545 [Candidatus Hodarchaeota archaeon]